MTKKMMMALAITLLTLPLAAQDQPITPPLAPDTTIVVAPLVNDSANAVPQLPLQGAIGEMAPITPPLAPSPTTPAPESPTIPAPAETVSEEFDWEPVMEAIIWHESKGNPRAVCGPYVGVMQIAPVMVRECNNILKQRGQSKRYQLNDRYSVEKSKEIFKLIMSKYNPENDIDKACRIWAGGIRYNVRRTQPFVDWVHRYIEEHRK